MYEDIEALKRKLTDKHVVVVGDWPELARFAGKTGQVKTVNMNGRALVEFNAWSNTGWYDIDPKCLEIVAEPAAPAAVAKEAKAVRPPDATSIEKSAESTPATSGAEIKSDPAPKVDIRAPRVTHEAGHEAPVAKRPRPQS
jgi:hypothetical protein